MASLSKPSAIHLAGERRTTYIPPVPPTEATQPQPIQKESPQGSSEMLAGSTSPPPIHVEPDVPDPFLLDDPNDPMSDEDGEDTRTPAHEIMLGSPQPPSPTTKPTISALVSSKTGISSEDEDEEDAPEIYLPGLVIPTMFLPIPTTDPLTTLLTKYIYPPEKRPVRDLSGEWQRTDFHTLVMTNSWRALARMARDRIVTTDPEELPLILGLWYLRLSSLSRLRLFNQTSAECTNLFSVLTSLSPPSTRDYLFDHLLPFELEVMYARLKYWSGDHMAYLDALSALQRKCRTRARGLKGKRVDEEGKAMWVERGTRVSLIIASQLMEMKDYTAAAIHLTPLLSTPSPSPHLVSSIARIHLQSGNIAQALALFAQVDRQQPQDDEDKLGLEKLKRTNRALVAAAEGRWEEASSGLRACVEKDHGDFVSVNNLAVALLSEGKLKEGIDVLEAALYSSPSSVVVAEPFLFNLSTLYELRSATAAENKRNLLVEVAKWSGDGLRTTCLKMPSN